MSAPFEEGLLRIPMSWDDYLRLPEQPRAEWVNGVAVIMNTPPGFRHGTTTVELAFILRGALPDLYVAVESYLRLPGDAVRLPDVMVTMAMPEDDFVSEAPLMVAEVLSHSTRTEDLVAKKADYLEGGVGQYWIVDPQQRELLVLRNVNGSWETLAQADDAQPEVSVALAGVTVSLDVRQLLRS